VNYYIQAAGGCDAADGSAVTVTINAPPDVDVHPATLTFSQCDVKQAVSFTSDVAGSYSITNTATDSRGSYNESPANFTLVVNAEETTPPPPPPPADTDNDGVPDSSDNCPTVANADQANADADIDNLGDACDSNSYAPAVGTQAGAANGNEGSPGNPTTSGSFTDRDGNGSLSITQVSGAGSISQTTAQKAAGEFSWSHTTTDDAWGSVTVKASDGEHADATQTFSWTAANVAPVISAVTVVPTGPCSVSISAPFTDQGSDDMHSSAISWGDGTPDSTVGLSSNASPVTGSHTYAAGTYTIGVSVTDDDGGNDSKNAASGFTTMNTPSQIMQPINYTGTRSGFKIGSSIPVKITVTDCNNAAVTTLTPTVSLSKVDNSPDVAVNEVISTSTPTSGTTMRWSDTQYIYNLSTKNSQFNAGQALTAGTYRVTVSDPSFYQSVTATFDLRK
jgi:hypothetical protein